jgi:lactam utilization protein B
MTKQQNEDEDKQDRRIKEMMMKDLTDILSTIDMAAEKLCDINPDGEHSSAVKRSIRAMLQENKKKIKTVNVTFSRDVF